MVHTTEVKSYEKQANDFLTLAETTFSAKLNRFDKYFADDEQARNIFDITLKNKQHTYRFEFGDSIHNSCKETPKIETPFKCEIYCGWSFGIGIKAYFSHAIKTDYPTLRKIIDGEIKSFDIINNDELLRDFKAFEERVKEVQKKDKHFNIPLSFRTLQNVFSEIDQRINKYISEEAKKETALYAQAKPVKTPTAYSVLACLQKYEVGTFENFCSEFGYDTDSRKAHKTYKAVVKEWENVQKLFSGTQLEQLQEIQ